MNEKLKGLMALITTKNDEVCAIHDKVDADQDGAPTADQFARVKALNKEIEEAEKAAADSNEFEAHKSAADARKAQMATPVAGHAHGNGGGDKGGLQIAKSFGDSVIEDPGFKAWLSANNPGQSTAQFGHSPKVQLKMSMKALITGLSSTSGGALITNDRLGIVDTGTFARPLTVRDIVTNGNTDSDVVEYVRQGSHTNAAAPTAEATGTGDSTGTKPESTMVLAIITETVKTIAHWIPATRRSLADAAQLRTLVDAFLRYGLEEELEDQMLTGDGVGENFTGLLNVTGTTAQAFDTDLLVTTRKARTKVRTTGRATPTAYVMNPTDWQTIDLLKDNESRYYFGGPSVLGTPRLWGLPVVESEGMTAGTSMVADWRLAVLWDREMANILVSDSHSDFFIRNLIAILAELRAAFGTIRPSAFVEIAHS